MTEAKAEDLFNKCKRQLIRKLGRRALYNDEIDAICQRLFGKRWGGCHPSDKLPLKPNIYYIANTGNQRSNGIHWVSCVTTKTRVYVYDSFSRHPSNLLKTLSSKAERKGLVIVEANQDEAEQRGDSAICGHISIAWLIVVHQMGIRAACTI